MLQLIRLQQQREQQQQQQLPVRFRLQRRPPMPCQPIKKPVKIKARPVVVHRVGVGVEVGRLPPSAVGQLGSCHAGSVCVYVWLCLSATCNTPLQRKQQHAAAIFITCSPVICLGKELTVKFSSCASHARTTGTTTTQLSLPRKVAQVQCVSLARHGTGIVFFPSF